MTTSSPLPQRVPAEFGERFVADDDPDFILTCCRTAGLAPSEVQVDGTGRHHLVLLDIQRGHAIRFPRQEADAEGIATLANMQARVHGCGIPAPEVLDCQEGPVGVAHIRMPWVDGRGLDDPQIQRRMEQDPRSFASQLHDLLQALESGPIEGWPRPPLNLPASFQRLEDDLNEVGPDLPETFVARCLQAAGRARAAADRAEPGSGAAMESGLQSGLMHGDLGGVNCRLDEDGRIVAVLDWDSAQPGDPAVDLTAVLEGIPAVCGAELLSRNEKYRSRYERCRVYVATWVGQAVVWAYQHGDRESLDRLLTHTDGVHWTDPGTEIKN